MTPNFKKNKTEELWINPNPTKSMGYTANITLKNNNYDELEFIFFINTNNTLQIKQKVEKGYGINVTYADGYNRRFFSRNANRMTDTIFSISEAYQGGEGITGTSANNSILIPYKIIGIKY